VSVAEGDAKRASFPRWGGSFKSTVTWMESGSGSMIAHARKVWVEAECRVCDLGSSRLATSIVSNIV
jgi:hypothetical protein